MASVRLQFPVLVRNVKVEDKPQYYIRPLFFSYPVATNRRFENAMHSFRKETRDYFKGFEITKDTMETLLWFNFQPNGQYAIKEMEFTVGSKYVKEQFGISCFFLKDTCFVLLPQFENFMFIAPKNKQGKVDVLYHAEEAIKNFFKAEKKEFGDFDEKSFAANKGDFITNVDLYVHVVDGKFTFEQPDNFWFFASMLGDSNFDGSVEIEKVGYDLNNLYPSELQQAFYRNDIVKKISDTLYQKDNTPIVLVGEEGVGKHSILHQAIREYIESNHGKDRYLLQKVWHLDPTRVISGMSIVGMWQKRFEAILAYVKDRRKDMKFKRQHTDILLVDNVVALLRIGKSSQNDMNLSSVLKPYLEQRKFQVIFLATPEEWKIVQEKDRRFGDLFQVLRIEQPSFMLAAQMVLKQRKLLELEHGGKISNFAIAQLFTIYRNYFKRKALPGGVMKLLRQLAIKYKFQFIDAEEVRTEFEQFSGLHQDIFDTGYTFEKEEVRKHIKAQLIGQPQAVDTLANVIHTIKAKLTNPNKPLGSFMFIGPTGVGKTQAAKILCNYLMGSEDYLLRFDMNEYIDYSAVDRLIGTYYKPEGDLTGKVRYRPFGIVLFDEIEKAHPKVHDLLLQVLDDGRLTDSLGRTVDFTNTIIIMTSNVGATDVSMQVGYRTSQSDDSAVYQKALERQFRPEFINRIDDIVVFKPLQLEHTLKIARLQINELLSRDGFIRRTTILNISPDALEWVARRGYDEKMGGRALKRQIEKDLTALSAEQLIKTHTDVPIIFEISFENNQLRPKVTPLEFADAYEEDWLPKLPNERQTRRFYKNLLRKIDSLNYQIRRLEEEEDFEEWIEQEEVNWLYYDFKNKIVELKEHHQMMMLDMAQSNINNPVIPFRLKRVGQVSIRNKMTVYRRKIKDDSFQREALRQLTDEYKYSALQFDRLGTQLMEDYIDLVFLKLYAKGVKTAQVDTLVIRFSSAISNMGKKEIKTLMTLYKDLLEGLHIEYDEERKKEFSLTFEGFGLYELLKSEAGYHLFYVPHSTPIPIKVEIIKNGVVSKTLPEVIRVYDGDTTITDIRTGFTNAGNISASEFKLLLYGALSEEVKAELV